MIGMKKELIGDPGTSQVYKVQSIKSFAPAHQILV